MPPLDSRQGMRVLIAIALLIAAIIGPAGLYSYQLGFGRDQAETIKVDIRRLALVRSVDQNFVRILFGLAGALAGIDSGERALLLSKAAEDVRAATAVGSPLDKLMSASADLQTPADQITLWATITALGESLDHVAEWRSDGASDEERSFHVLRAHDSIGAAREVLERLEGVLEKRIKQEVDVSTGLLDAAMPMLWTIEVAGALVGAAIVFFMLATIRRLERARSELQDSRTELSQQNARFRDAIESMGQGLVMFDADNRLIVCNEQFARLYGIGPLPPGTPFQSIVDHWRDTGVLSEGGGRLQIVPERDSNWIARLPDGRVISINRRVRQAGGWIGTHTDITELKRAEDERLRAEAEATRARDHERAMQATSRAKADFFATMSHEIRTPLNGLLGLASTLLETGLDADQRKTLEAVNQSGESLLAILNDILDLSKLDAGRVQFEQVAFSPRELADAVVGVIRPQARAKEVSLFLSVAGDVPELMLGDPGRIRQVLLNLAGNAVKFTDPGGEVELTLACRARDAERAVLEWSVRDTGIGIAPEHLASLFTDYVQADSSINRRFGGTGLGLAISKRLAEQMGGDITVISALNQGSTFTLCLPLRVTHERRTAGVAGPVSHAAFTAALGRLGRPLRLLLAEDNITNQLVVTRMLRTFDITIRIVEDGEAAVAAVMEHACDVVLMDVRMPGMDGLAATRQIRARGGRFATLPIVALTANAFPEDMGACREAGMTGFVAKPVRKAVLVEALAQAVQAVVYGGAGTEDRGEAVDNLPAPAVVLRAASGEEKAPVLDGAVAAALCDEIGEDGVAATVTCFLADTRERLDGLAGLAAAADRRRLGIEAHTLKSAAGAIGFRRLAGLALTLEREAADIAPERAADLVAALAAAFRDAEAAAVAHRLARVA
ncbi:hypothetical protein CH340_15330 [Rhodoplanes serenus]|nr:hypothetical protein CH340_15330 [Rhodoplanes serenus]